LFSAIDTFTEECGMREASGATFLGKRHEGMKVLVNLEL